MSGGHEKPLVKRKERYDEQQGSENRNKRRISARAHHGRNVSLCPG